MYLDMQEREEKIDGEEKMKTKQKNENLFSKKKAKVNK